MHAELREIKTLNAQLAKDFDDTDEKLKIYKDRALISE